LRIGTSLIVLHLAVAAPLAAQSFWEQFSYDGLRFAGIGVEFGGVVSNSITSEPIGGVRVDLGTIAPRVRVVVGGSYFKGSFKPERVADFERRLQDVLVGCACDSVSVGPITQANAELFLALQYLIPPVGRLQPYGGVGFSAHIRDGDGAVIDDTFVEDALDTVAAGIDASAGVDVALLRRLALLVEVRGVLTSELRSLSVRGGLMLRFP
jgi:hypothetical protein